MTSHRGPGPARRGPGPTRRGPGPARREHRRPSRPPAPTAPPEVLPEPVEVGRPAHGGFTVARAGEVVTLVRHAAPGELVRIAVTARRSRVWFAEAVEVLRAAPERVPHVWPEAGPGGVGGGELGHVARAAQLRWKTEVLAGTLRRIGGEQVAADVAAVGPVEVRAVDDGRAGTRTRVELTAGADGAPGMHRYRGREVLPVGRLPLADPRLDVAGLLGLTDLQPGTRVRGVVGSGPGAAPAVLIGGRGADRAIAERVPTVLGPIDYTVAAGGFWQVHAAAPAALVETVLALSAGEEPALPGIGQQAADADAAAQAGTRVVPDADAAAQAGTRIVPVADAPARVGTDRAEGLRAALDGARVLELYSGAGLLSAALGRAAVEGRVLTLEGSARAVADARTNLADLPNVRALAGTVDADAVTRLGREGEWTDGGVVVLDPPRAGAGAEVMSAVAALAPARIVHVACDPAALARDLAAARAAGYVVENAVALDLFPHTHHLEVIASLVPA